MAGVSSLIGSAIGDVAQASGPIGKPQAPVPSLPQLTQAAGVASPAAQAAPGVNDLSLGGLSFDGALTRLIQIGTNTPPSSPSPAPVAAQPSSSGGGLLNTFITPNTPGLPANVAAGLTQFNNQFPSTPFIASLPPDQQAAHMQQYRDFLLSALAGGQTMDQVFDSSGTFLGFPNANSYIDQSIGSAQAFSQVPSWAQPSVFRLASSQLNVPSAMAGYGDVINNLPISQQISAQGLVPWWTG